MLELDKEVKKNHNGEFIAIYENHFEEGVEYASQIKIGQLQIREAFAANKRATPINFMLLEQLSSHLRIISINTIKKHINLESLYSLQNLEKLFIQKNKQKTPLDISKFPKLIEFGGDYWDGLIGIENSLCLRGVCLYKLPDADLARFSKLTDLETLHICDSTIQSLYGIQKLPIKRLFLVRNKLLEEIEALNELKKLEYLSIEKCNQIAAHEIIKSLRSKISVVTP